MYPPTPFLSHFYNNPDALPPARPSVHPRALLLPRHHWLRMRVLLLHHHRLLLVLRPAPERRLPLSAREGVLRVGL